MSQGRLHLLASYPKSGNTWMRLLLGAYFGNSTEDAAIDARGVVTHSEFDRKIFDDLLGLDSSALRNEEIDALLPSCLRQLASNGEGPVWLKVHSAQRRLAEGQWLIPGDLVVYLVRNPLDIVVSLAAHLSHDNVQEALCLLCGEDSREIPLRTHLRQKVGDWSSHVLSWTAAASMPVLVVRYEDMLLDAAHELQRVLRFAWPDMAIDTGRCAQAAQSSSFERLQLRERTYGFDERLPLQQRFFRSGRAGDWLNNLSAAHADRVRAMHLAQMERLGYE